MQPRDHLIMAIRSQRLDAITDLLNQVKPDEELEDKFTAIQLARNLGHWNVVETIAKNKKADTNDTARYGAALVSAVKIGRLDSARILLNAGASLDWTTGGDSCLDLAIRNNDKSMLTLLLSFNFDLTRENNNKKTPIELASHLNHWECVETIARTRRTDAEDKARYGSALLSAVKIDRLDSAKILLAAGASRHWTFDIEEGCLHTAIRQNNASMVAMLLSFGFDLKRKNKWDETPQALADELKRVNQLKVNCLDEGWTMYWEHLMSLKAKLAVVAQSMRQPKSAFYKIPKGCTDLIVSFLNKKTPKENINSSRRFLARISANCLLTTASMLPNLSETSNVFLTELKGTLQNGKSENIENVISNFLEKKNDKTQILPLLQKYKLFTPRQVSAEKSATRSTSVVRWHL